MQQLPRSPAPSSVYVLPVFDANPRLTQSAAETLTALSTSEPLCLALIAALGKVELLAKGRIEVTTDGTAHFRDELGKACSLSLL